MNLDILQVEVRAWSDRNFPNSGADDKLLGVVEEIGELAHAVLKSRQGIRGNAKQHEAAEQDAIGDIVIYLLDYCGKRGWSLDTLVRTAWAEVQHRDWMKHQETGLEELR